MEEAPLTGWKEIAAFLGNSVRTAQRFEREFGLPVHRTQASKGALVRAYPSELRRWLEKRDDTAFEPRQPEEKHGIGDAAVPLVPRPLTRRRRAPWFLTSLALSLVALGLAFFYLGSVNRATSPASGYRHGGPENAFQSIPSNRRQRVTLAIRPTGGPALEVQVADGGRANVNVAQGVSLTLQPSVRGSNVLLDLRRAPDDGARAQAVATVRLTESRPAHVDIAGIGMEIEWRSH